jgi:hypothetical protein
MMIDILKTFTSEQKNQSELLQINSQVWNSSIFRSYKYFPWRAITLRGIGHTEA